MRRSPARYLAPIALIAAIAATYVVVHHGLTPKHKKAHPHAVARRHGKFAKAKFYIVQAGDTLSTISVKTGIPVPTLEALNPSVNPNALQTGQRLRLRR
jgi:LysM repeat protein